ncbi:lysoplasmalogenase [Marinobacter sp. 2_MG-2023]|uniref:lysoplasmalogenase n=1 Tax=Marinobacter sp. 2_MG-2023 TaxID=3062679 RepID=UPI0026E2A1A8|nr:lysoplasmalogenase [Marinobacter sp. 2_MG-2023]MDO6441498.1 lysoplasmalogenase [Marinobacter sp. 2_MG-2023]
MKGLRNPGLFTLALVCGYAYVVSIAFKPYDFSYLLKVTPVLLLALIAFLQKGSKLSNRQTYVFILAMLASASGDVFLDLDRNLYLKQALGSFLITQLAYLYLFLPMRDLTTGRRWLMPPLAVIVVFLLYLISHTAGALLVPVVVYCLVLLAMAFSALLVKNNLWINIGGMAFFIADALIGVNRFIISFEYSTTVIVTIYISAQLMIAWGLLFHRGRESARSLV